LPVNNKNTKNSGICCCKIITFALIFFLVKEGEDTVQKTLLVIYVHVSVIVCGGERSGERQNNSPIIQPHMTSIWIDKASMVITLEYESVNQ